jgi:hypothetical protein
MRAFLGGGIFFLHQGFIKVRHWGTLILPKITIKAGNGYRIEEEL